MTDKRDLSTTPEFTQDEILRALDEQQRRYVELRAKGLTPQQAAAAVGALPLGREVLRERFFEHPLVQAAIQQLNRAALTRMQITRETVAEKLLDAYTLSTTATEQVKALSELARLYGLYEPERRELSVSVSEAKLRQLSDYELSQLAGIEVTDAEYEEVDGGGAEDGAAGTAGRRPPPALTSGDDPAAD